MRPAQWNPPIELSASEQVIVKRIRRAKLLNELLQEVTASRGEGEQGANAAQETMLDCEGEQEANNRLR